MPSLNFHPLNPQSPILNPDSFSVPRVPTLAITKRLRITGLVQGVFYRESMRRRANQLGMTGWVRNRADG